jgi:hypothetical protein
MTMEEILYNIEIHKDSEQFLGKIYSDIDGVKEFKNDRIDRLLRDIIFDMQLALDEFSNRSAEFGENIEEIK